MSNTSLTGTTKPLITQREYNIMATDAVDAAQQFASGCLTLHEVARYFAVLNQKLDSMEMPEGLIDPITGLRFPSKAEVQQAKSLATGG